MDLANILRSEIGVNVGVVVVESERRRWGGDPVWYRTEKNSDRVKRVRVQAWMIQQTRLT